MITLHTEQNHKTIQYIKSTCINFFQIDIHNLFVMHSPLLLYMTKTCMYIMPLFYYMTKTYMLKPDLVVNPYSLFWTSWHLKIKGGEVSTYPRVIILPLFQRKI